MVIHVGYLRAGWRGLIVAGTLFILPAATIVLALAWAYVQYGATPTGESLLYGIKPVIIAVIAQALWGLGRTAIKGPLLLADRRGRGRTLSPRGQRAGRSCSAARCSSCSSRPCSACRRGTRRRLAAPFGGLPLSCCRRCCFSRRRSR